MTNKDFVLKIPPCTIFTFSLIQYKLYHLNYKKIFLKQFKYFQLKNNTVFVFNAIVNYKCKIILYMMTHFVFDGAFEYLRTK